MGKTAGKDILRTDLFLMACFWLFRISDIGGSGFAAFLSTDFGIVLSSDEYESCDVIAPGINNSSRAVCSRPSIAV